MDNNKKTTKFLPQGHAPVVKKELLLLHTFSDTTRELDSYCLLSMRKGLETVEMTNPIMAVSVKSAIMGLVPARLKTVYTITRLFHLDNKVKIGSR